MLCTSSISRKNYYCKHIVYDGQKKLLCTNCSKKGLENKVKNTELLEFKDCSVCTKIVKFEAIYCNECHHWIHPACEKIGKDELKRLGNSSEDWSCRVCNNRKHINNVTYNSVLDEYLTHDDCQVCSNKVAGSGTLCCSNCRHWIHKKCIGEFTSRSEFSDFLQYYSDREWECPPCKAKQLPFIMLANDEFYAELIDIFNNPIYLNRNNFQKIYNKINQKDFYHTDENSNENKNNTIDNHDPDLNFQSFDSCEYSIDVQEIGVNSKGKGLVMATFNIRSIKKHFLTIYQLIA